MNSNLIQSQYRDLIFALHKAWPMVHGCSDDALKRECSSIMRACGDFADAPVKIGPALNRRIYFALERAQRFVDHPWVSDSRKHEVSSALSKHAGSKEDWIRSGNCPDADSPARDHSMRPKEYWETRPSPASPHHWTRAEFLKHLADHSFPANTINDRLAVHTQAIRDALVAGSYVPPEVLADESGLQAVGDAIMTVRASAYARSASASQEANRRQFCSALHRLDGGMRAGLSLILAGAAKEAQKPVTPGLEPWVAGGYKEVVSADGYPHPVMVCSLRGSQGIRIDFRDGRYEPNSLFGTVHSIRIDEAASIYNSLLDRGLVTMEEVQSVIGYDAMQYLARPVIEAVYPRDRS